MSCLFIILIIVGILILFFIKQKQKMEMYGGPIRNIKRIPQDDCIKICDTYHADCMQKYGFMSADRCHKRFKEHCPLECQMSDYQRM